MYVFCMSYKASSQLRIVHAVTAWVSSWDIGWACG